MRPLRYCCESGEGLKAPRDFSQHLNTYCNASPTLHVLSANESDVDRFFVTLPTLADKMKENSSGCPGNTIFLGLRHVESTFKFISFWDSMTKCSRTRKRANFDRIHVCQFWLHKYCFIIAIGMANASGMTGGLTRYISLRNRDFACVTASTPRTSAPHGMNRLSSSMFVLGS